MELRIPERRWQPPSLQPKVEAASKVTVDEKVVRKMLAVNPSMRKGRTTFQVKKALERGESIAATESTAAVVVPTTALSSANPASDIRRELAETIGFFVRGKKERWQAKLADLAAQRHAVNEAQEQARTELSGQLISFVVLLDSEALASAGRGALAEHAEFLGELGLTAASLLDAAIKGKRQR